MFQLSNIQFQVTAAAAEKTAYYLATPKVAKVVRISIQANATQLPAVAFTVLGEPYVSYNRKFSASWKKKLVIIIIRDNDS